ncbi:serine/arginine repetitive matrix protein 2-like [Acanthaster planci]|uniref:Serine/arginine repetitive matrix protein 2-like n=1 Tax=Acanthaster planci TaxID=133434 RepID=A0A8B7XJN0_ACAPL|nr:serine/arginine repetitive matrix protein 2-like [Acanthaster planci]
MSTRRAKIRPSINLSASRRSVTTPASKAKDPTASKPEAAEPKTGLRSSTKPTIPQPSKPQVNSVQRHQEEPKVQTQQQEELNHEKPKQADKQQQQKSLQRQREKDREKRQQDDIQGEPDPLPSEEDSLGALTQPAPVSPTKHPAKPSLKSTPESPLKSSATVRRKRINAVPNLGQPRLRSGPALPVKTAARASVTPEREVEVERGGARGRVGRAGGSRPEPEAGEMGPPLHPPPVQRVISASASSTPTPDKEPTREAPNRSEEPSLPATVTSQSSHAPSSTTTPLRPTLARTDSVTEKHPVGSENIYEKKLRELKDRIDSETPSRRRRHYVKQKVQPPERSKMTMSDLIYFNPKTSPMKNIPAGKEKKFPRTIMTENVASANNSVNSSAHNSENEEGDEEEDIDPFAPQVKIGPDGSIILDNTSLVKDASPAKNLHLSDSDVVEEEFSRTTYSSFRDRKHTTAWSQKDTEKFYRALSAVGTDFSMIKAMFPKRTRQQIKNKFKREERLNRQRLDRAIRERKQLDMSLFDKEPSSDSELENHAEKKSNEKGKSKSTGKRRGKGRGKNKGKIKDEDAEKDSDVELINDDVDAKAGGDGDSKDVNAGDAEGEMAKDGAARQSDGSEDEIDMETILSQPTRSGRQPKVKTTFTVEEPQRRRKGPYKRSSMEDPNYASRRLERLNREREIILARRKATKSNFPPYTSGGAVPSPSSGPANPSLRQVSLAGLRQVAGEGKNQGIELPGSRGISTINTPMGRFIVSVPQQPSSPRPVGSPTPEVPSSAAGAGVAKKVLRTHIFVISSPDGTQNIIQVPVQPDPTSQDSSQPPRSPQPAQNLSQAGPAVHNPPTAPRIIVRTLRPNPQQTATTMRQVVLPSPQQLPGSSSMSQTGDQVASASPLSGPAVITTAHNQRAQVERSPQRSQHYHLGKRGNADPLTLQTPGSNKVIVISPHAQVPSRISEAAVETTCSSNFGETRSLGNSISPKVITQTHHSAETVQHHEHNLTSESHERVSHMTSNMDTDWLLRDETVGHEVNIPTSDFEEATETEEAFIPPASNVGRPPLMNIGTDQAVMDHVTEENLTAQDILEQMTYEEGVGGDVGANMEVAINEEIITQIANTMEVE